MANRSIRALLNTLYVDHRYHAGSIIDHSGNGQDGVFVAGQEPEFRREIGGAVGLHYPDPNSNRAIQLAAATMAGVFAWEVSLYSRSAGGLNAGRITNAASLNLRWNGANIFFDCGVTLQTALANPFIGTIVATRDSSDDGHIYANGILLATGAVGNGALAAHVVTIGNSTGWNRSFDGVIYSLRLFATHLDADEVARLHQFSRLQLWPGAPKRSGIISPV